MNIRPAEKNDIEALLPLWRQLGHEPIAPEQLERDVLAHPSTEIIIITDNAGALVGSVVWSTRGVPLAGIAAYIDDLVVDGQHRGKGYGRLLIEEVIRRAQAAGCVRIDFTCGSHRESALALYEKVGFKKRETNCYVLALSEGPRY